jgi:hypothetical protein
MKNVHVLPKEEKLDFKKNTLHNEEYKPLYIYITSNEEIKEGDWFYLNDAKIVVKYIDLKPVKEAKKIILTTDQDLIKDGVQPIDDKFFSWFVKNPSCESVEVDLFPKNSNKLYGIIIPKEEPKQYFYCSDRLELDENERCVTQCDHCAVIQPKYTIGCDPYDKQETLEEASWKFNPLKKLDGEFLRHAFKEGAKSDAAKDYWFEKFKQAERMYSEEDMMDYSNYRLLIKKTLSPKEWFEQFKNK